VSTVDGARQALRWSIPGFIFVLEVYVFHAVWLVVLGKDPLTQAKAASGTTTLATVFAGVPLPPHSRPVRAIVDACAQAEGAAA